MRKNTIENVIKIANCLNKTENGWLWPTEISKRINLHRKTITRLIEKYLSNFIEEETLRPSNIRMFKLKKGTEINSILKFMLMQEKINNAINNRK